MRELKDIIHNGKNMLEWLEINRTEDADLSGADLSYADLSGANLSYANLSDADLSYANLSDANGKISVFSGGKHQGVAHCTHISVGCERHTHAEWRKNYKAIGERNNYTSEEIERYRVWIFSLDWLIEA